jgi:anti-sigma regulatory factor (Ser/Thr protein kinase)
MGAVASLPLSRDARTPAEARQFVVSRLAESGHGELCDAAALVTSELVTNVLVHTDSVPVVRVLVGAEVVRIEVEDGCPVLPVAGMLDPTAVCGRGLVLVEQFTQRWGVSPVAQTGKVVWLELVAGVPGVADQLSADDLLDAWGDDEDVLVVPTLDADGDVPDGDAPSGIRRVRVEGVSSALLNGTKAHLDDLVRDLTLVNEAPRSDGRADEELVDLAARLAHLATDLIAFRNQIRRQALDAVRRGAETLTLELDLPISLGARLLDYRRALDEAEEHCAAGRLLVPVAPPEHVEFRRWKLDRIIAGLADAGSDTPVG